MFSDLPSISLLVRGHADALRPHALEDPPTGRRISFDALPALLAALSMSLAPDDAPVPIRSQGHPAPGVPKPHPGEDA